MLQAPKLGVLRGTLRHLEDLLIITLVLALLLLAVAQILGRNLLGIGIIWADSALRMGVLWITLLGAMAACRENAHIRINLLEQLQSTRLKHLAQGGADFCAAVVCGLLCYASSRLVYFDWLDQTQAFLNLPAWPFELIMPCGFLIMALRFFVQSLANWRGEPLC